MPDLSCLRERVVLGGWLLEGGGELMRIVLRAALAAAAAVRRCQAGANFASLRLASRTAAVLERVVRNSEVCSRVSLGKCFAGSWKRTVLLSAL